MEIPLNQPYNEKDHRYICTKEYPYQLGMMGNWQHPDSKDDGTCSKGCCDYYICNICHHTI